VCSAVSTIRKLHQSGASCQKSPYICWDLLRNAEHLWEFPLGYPSFSFAKEPYINEPLYLLGSCGKRGAPMGGSLLWGSHHIFREFLSGTRHFFLHVQRGFLVTHELFREISLLYPSVLNKFEKRRTLPSVPIGLSFKRAQHSYILDDSHLPTDRVSFAIEPYICRALLGNPIFAELLWETWGYALVGPSFWPSYSGVPRQQM